MVIFIMSEKSEYCKDYYAWLIRMANLVREKNFDAISEYNLYFISDEMEGNARMVRNELDNLLQYLMAFFLILQHKCKYNDGWLTDAVIEAKRSEINIILYKSPSLEKYISDSENLDSNYSIARLIATRLSNKSEEIYCEKRQLTLDKILHDKLTWMV